LAEQLRGRGDDLIQVHPRFNNFYYSTDESGVAASGVRNRIRAELIYVSVAGGLSGCE
jgi:hypothetical protein